MKTEDGIFKCCRIVLLLLVITTFFTHITLAATKYSQTSGNWSDPSVWSGNSIPSTGDHVVIGNSHEIRLNDPTPDIQSLSIRSNAVLEVYQDALLNIAKDIIIDGKIDIEGGNISLKGNAQKLILGKDALLLWNPGNNSLSGHELWIKSIETLHPTSTVIIKSWYDYNIPFTQHLSGEVGNLTLNSIVGNQIMKWNQDNGFETHQIKGTLTIGQAWIVLDQSGSISKTEIGNIHLENVNSHLYFHEGHHQGSVVVNTGDIINYYGRIYGIVDGNASLDIKLDGSFINHGEVSLIKNETAISGGAGNLNFHVSGEYIQHEGDFRGIFNLLNANSGIYNYHFGSLIIQNGIWLGSYACHLNAQTCSLKVDQDLEVSIANTSGLFRMIGLSSIAGYKNTANLHCTIGGTWKNNSLSTTEITTCASQGMEEVVIGGDMLMENGIVSFNYGSLHSAHRCTLSIANNLQLDGGTLYLSRLNEEPDVSVGGSLILNRGRLILQAGNSGARMSVQGDALFMGGEFYLHGNDISALQHHIECKIMGNTEHHNSKIFFDDCPASNGQVELLLAGNSIGFSGNGYMQNKGSGSSSLTYQGIGNVSYSNVGTAARFENIKQIVDSACKLTLMNGDIEVGYDSPQRSMGLRVRNGGILDLQSGTAGATGTGQTASLFVDDGAILMTANPFGLYDNTEHAAVNAVSGLDYNLRAESTVIYYGAKVQQVNGYSIGSAELEHHKYGILKIDKPSQVKSLLSAEQTIVRTRLELNSGLLDLNNKTLVIESSDSDAIRAGDGSIQSYKSRWKDNSFVTWNMKSPAQYIVPFSSATGIVVPIEFSTRSGQGPVSILTYESSTRNNKPYPSAGPTGPVSHINNAAGMDFSESSAVDRWFIIAATGITADISLSYLQEEDTSDPGLSGSEIRICSWQGSAWSTPFGNLINENSQTGTVQALEQNKFGTWLLYRVPKSKTHAAIALQATAVARSVELKWQNIDNQSSSTYLVERSKNGTQFEIIGINEIESRNKKMTTHFFKDMEPLQGASYYRISTNNDFGQYMSSEIVQVNFSEAALRVNLIYPNPFDQKFTMEFESRSSEEAEVTLYNLSGQEVLREKIIAEEGKNIYQFSKGSDLSPGSYIVSLKCSSGEFSKRILKSL